MQLEDLKRKPIRAALSCDRSLVNKFCFDVIFTVMLWFQGSNDPKAVEKIMADLDENKDGEVDFQEFVLMVAALTVACNEFFTGYTRAEEKEKAPCPKKAWYLTLNQ